MLINILQVIDGAHLTKENTQSLMWLSFSSLFYYWIYFMWFYFLFCFLWRERKSYHFMSFWRCCQKKWNKIFKNPEQFSDNQIWITYILHIQFSVSTYKMPSSQSNSQWTASTFSDFFIFKWSQENDKFLN